MFVDQADTVCGGFRSDQHDQFQVVAVGSLFIVWHIVGKREVGDDHAVYTGFHTLLTECLEAELHDRIEVTHQYQRHLNFLSYILQLVEQEM